MKKFVSILIILICIFSGSLFAAENSLKNSFKNTLQLDAYIKDDGMIQVTELWNVICDSNAFERTYKVPSYKNIELSNLKVSASYLDISGERDFELYSGEVHFGQYNVISSGDDVKILCGVDKFNKNENMIYKISYTLKDMVAMYNDCAEFNGRIIENGYPTNIDEANIMIHFPSRLESETQSNAWIKTESFSEILQPSKDGITFKIDNCMRTGFIELRILFPTELFTGIKTTTNIVIKDKIVRDENNAVNDNNFKQTLKNVAINLFELIILIWVVIMTYQYLDQVGRIVKIIPKERIRYTQELPLDVTTPGQAAFIKNVNLKMGNLVSATIMDLKLKGIITVSFSKENGQENTYIQIVDEEPTLAVEEKIIFDFILGCAKKYSKEDLKISLKQLKKYITSSSKRTSTFRKRVDKVIKQSVSSYSEKENQRIGTSIKKVLLYVCILFVILVLHGIEFDLFSIHTWLTIACLFNMLVCIRIAFKVNIFDQNGINDREKLRAFERFMFIFPKFGAKGAPEIDIWEYYLVYASAFGISKYVLKNIKDTYINIEKSSSWEALRLCKSLVDIQYTDSFLISTSSK